MAKFYVTRLWLTCKLSNNEALAATLKAAFEQRWTRQLEEEWSLLLFPYDEGDPQQSDEDLRSKLSGKIEEAFSQAGGFIPQDIAAANLTFEDLPPVFTPAEWSFGSGGAHESRNTPITVTIPAAQGGQAQWMVPPRGPNGEGAVFANCEWRIASV